MSNDTTRDAFEAWFLAYRKGTWQPLSSDPRKDMPKHWNIGREMDCWRGWQAATEQGKRQVGDAGFIRKTNIEYAAWCGTYYQADALDERGMKSLHGLWAWQEQERRSAIAKPATVQGKPVAEGDAKDAEMFRWLQQQQDVTWQTDKGQWTGCNGMSLDHVISAAIASQKGAA